MEPELKVSESWRVKTGIPGFEVEGKGASKREALKNALSGIKCEVAHLQAQIDAYSAPKAQLEAALAALGQDDGGTG